MLRLFILVLVVFVCGCGKGTKQEETKGKLVRQPVAESVPSIIQILATPDRFDGRRVRIEGFLVFDNNQPLLFLHEEDANYLVRSNGLLIYLSRDAFSDIPNVIEKYHNKHVALRGTFKDKFVPPWHGKVVDVDRIEVSRRAEY